METRRGLSPERPDVDLTNRKVSFSTAPIPVRSPTFPIHSCFFVVASLLYGMYDVQNNFILFLGQDRLKRGREKSF